MPDALAEILKAAHRNFVRADNAEDGFLRVQEIAGVPLDARAFHAAVAQAVREGLILDPVFLPEGALQCHWRLSLTPAGLARARALIGP